MSFTAKSSGSSTFGQCTNPGFAFYSPLANASASFNTSSSPQKNIWAFTSVGPAPALGGNVASTSLFGGSSSPVVGASPTPTFGGFGTSSSPPESNRTSTFASPAPAAFGPSSSPFGTIKSSTAGFVPPAGSFGNASSPFRPSSETSSGCFGTSSSPPESNRMSTFASPAPSTALGASSSPFGTIKSSTAGFVPPAGSFGNASSPYRPSSETSSGCFQTTAASFGSPTLSFGVSATPNSDAAYARASRPHDSSSCISAPFPTFGLSTQTPAFRFPEIPSGSRTARYAATPECFGEHPEIVSICAMKIHSNKSHEELRATDYQFGDKGGPFHASVSRGSTGVADTQQNHWIFPFATSNTSSHSHVPGFSFTPQPSVSTVSNEWSTGPCRVCQDERNPFTSNHNAYSGGTSSTTIESIQNLFPSVKPNSSGWQTLLVPDQRNPFTSNPFASQAKGVDNAYSGGTSNTKIESIQNLFPSVKPNSSGWQTSESEGSRLTAYTETFVQQQGSFQSISAMPMFKNKSHEELRLSDYLLGDKGGCKEFLIARTEASLSTNQNPFVSSSASHQWPCSESSPSTNQFLSPSHNSTCSTTLPPANQSIPLSLSSGFSFPPIPFSTSFPCSTSTAPPSSVPFSFVSSGSAFSPSSMPSTFVSSGHSFSPSSTPFSFVSSGPSFSPSSMPIPFVSVTSSPGISSGTTSFSTSTDSQPIPWLAAPSDSIVSRWTGSKNAPITVPLNIPSSSISTTVPPTISSTVTPTLEQQSVFAKPFDPLNMAQTSVRHPGTTLPIQYGISSRPVTDNPSPAIRILKIKRLPVRRNRLQAEKHNAKSDSPKVAFFTEDERICVTANSDSSIIARNNPGCGISSPSKEIIRTADSQVSRPSRETTTSSEDIISQSARDVDENVEVVENIEVLLPKLVATDYYTEPSISEIAAKEKAEPGFCSRVKDFVVGRVGYGSIKFIGETDLRKQDLDSIIKFNHRELLVYFDESMEKPPVGGGLNKPAEVTLLKVKCIGSKNGNQYIDGPKVDKCRERLIKKTAEHGAEFVSYNPVLGEWKFRVQHF